MGKVRLAAGFLAVLLAGCNGARLVDDATLDPSDDRARPATQWVLADDFWSPRDANAYAGPDDAPPAGPVTSEPDPTSPVPAPSVAQPAPPKVAPPSAPQAVEVERAAGPAAAVPAARRWASPCAPAYDPCRPPCCPKPKPRCCGEGYIGVAATAFPGLGFNVYGGVIVTKNDLASLAVEVGMAYQDLWTGVNNNEKNTGKTIGANLGVRARFFPESRHHLIVRAGAGWRFLTEDNMNSRLGTTTRKGEYFGGYVGLGYEFDIDRNRCWATGPSVDFWGGVRPSGSGTAWTLTFGWHLVRRF